MTLDDTCGMGITMREQINVMDQQGTLWITDSASEARQLHNDNKAVLILLTEENKNEDFSDFPYAVEDLGSMDEETKEIYFERVYRRLKGLPWNILETGRCILRETTVEDVDAFYEIYKDPSMTLYMEDLYADPDEERQYIRDYIKNQYGFYDYGVWTVIDKQTDTIIGRAGLSVRPGEDYPELGFLITVSRQGKGYATEVCKAIIEYAYEQLEAKGVVAYVIPENTASIRVCEKVGMTVCGEGYDKGGMYTRYFIGLGEEQG